MQQCDVMVIGGGASGLVAALSAAREGAKVIVVEKQDRVGKKILATGNGRCNLTNTSIAAHSATGGSMRHYNDPDFVAPTLSRLDCSAIRDFFESIGLMTVADDKGWVFPRTRYANSVLDVLLRECKNWGVLLHTDLEVTQIKSADKVVGQRQEHRWEVYTASGNFSARSTIVATGHCVLLSTLGMNVVGAQPILGPLPVDAATIRGLDGVRVNAQVSLLGAEGVVTCESGEVLFKKQEISGIVSFNLSRYAQVGYTLELDLFPDYSKAELEAFLAKSGRVADSDIEHATQATGALKGMLHSRLAQAVLRQATVQPTGALNADAVKKIATALKGFSMSIVGTVDKTKAQVTRGGLSTDEFEPDSLASYKHPTLLAAGECLNIDGPCGGYNLHWAWASGITAGSTAARLVSS